jgi:hypothetical protein
MRNARSRVRLQHPFAQIVQDEYARGSAQSGECGLVHLGPGVRAGSEHDQPDAFAAEAERQYKQAGAAVASGLRIADHGSFAIVDLAFLTGFGDDDGAGLLWRRRSAQLVDETLDALITADEAVIVHQVLPDPLGIAASGERLFDQLAVRFTGARGCGWRRQTDAKAGDHPTGRFWTRVRDRLVGRVCAGQRVGDHLVGRF